MRLRDVVSRNREGTQTNPDMETQVTDRRDIYNGYNVSAALLRKAKVQTVTNRSSQEVFAYGPEMHGDEQRSLHPESRVALKAGIFDGEGTASQGRSSALLKLAAHRADLKHTFLGGEGMFEAQTPGQGRISEITGQRLGQDVCTSQHQMPRLSLGKLVPSRDVQGYIRRGIALGGKNDTECSLGTRHDGHERAATSRADGIIGDDSVAARDPYRTSTFSQSALLAEHILGTSDSTAAPDTYTLQPDFHRATQKTGIVRTRRNDSRRPLGPSVQQQGDRGALGGSRGRDGRNDSHASHVWASRRTGK